MAQFAAALQSLSSASCFVGQPRWSSVSIRLKVTALPLRLHTRVIRCHVDDLSPKELHQIRKKEGLKKLRKIRKERRTKRRAEEQAKIPRVTPNPALLKFERPLQNFNKPWKKQRGLFPSNQNVKPRQGLGFQQGRRWIGAPKGDGSSSIGWVAKSELPPSLFREFEAIYEEKMTKAVAGLNDREVLRTSIEETGDFEAAYARKSSNAPGRSTERGSEHNERYGRAKVVNERRDWRPGGEGKRTGSRDDQYRRDVKFTSPKMDSRRSFSQSPSKQVEGREVSEFWDNRETPGNGRLNGNLSRNEFEVPTESTSVVSEERMAAGTATARAVRKIVIGQRKGADVYLSIGDDDASEKRELPRDDLDEGKQLEWLAKQLNSVARPDGVHLSRVIRSGGLKITDGRAVTLVQKLGELGNWSCAFQVVAWLSSRNRFPAVRSRHLFTTLLAVLGKARRPIESLEIFNVMRDHVASYPDMPAYRVLAITLGQAGYLDELFELMQTLRQGPEKNGKFLPLVDNGRLIPDVVVYNAALNACVTHRHWRLALWILDQIQKEKDVRPNSTTYGLAIEVMVKAGKVDLAWKILGTMELGGFHPNSLTYKALVEGLGQIGKADLAVQMVKQMEQRGMVAVPGVYYALAATLCVCGKWQDALLQVDRISSLSGRPLVQTYTGLIKACKESGRWRDAISVFERMREVCAPNIGTCNIMISLYGAHGMYDEAKSLFEQIKKGRISPKNLYRSDPRLAPDAYTYDAMLGACTNAEEWGDLEVLFRQMLLQGYQLNSNRHAWIVQAISEAGKEDLVAAMFSHLRSLKGATAEMYVLMIKSFLSGGEQKKAFSHLDEMVDLNIRISSSDLQKIHGLALLLSDEDRLSFMGRVSRLRNTSEFNFAKDNRLLNVHQRSSALKQLKTRHGRRKAMNCEESMVRSLEYTLNPSLDIGSGQERSLDTALFPSDLLLRQGWPLEDVREDRRKTEGHSDDLQSASDILGWELLWKRSSHGQPDPNKFHLVGQLT